MNNELVGLVADIAYPMSGSAHIVDLFAYLDRMTEQKGYERALLCSLKTITEACDDALVRISSGVTVAELDLDEMQAMKAFRSMRMACLSSHAQDEHDDFLHYLNESAEELGKMGVVHTPPTVEVSKAGALANYTQVKVQRSFTFTEQLGNFWSGNKTVKLIIAVHALVQIVYWYVSYLAKIRGTDSYGAHALAIDTMMSETIGINTASIPGFRTIFPTITMFGTNDPFLVSMYSFLVERPGTLVMYHLITLFMWTKGVDPSAAGLLKAGFIQFWGPTFARWVTGLTLAAIGTEVQTRVLNSITTEPVNVHIIYSSDFNLVKVTYTSGSGKESSWVSKNVSFVTLAKAGKLTYADLINDENATMKEEREEARRKLLHNGDPDDEEGPTPKNTKGRRRVRARGSSPARARGQT